MARAPRSSVPKTSGQGVSRLAYQAGYKLRNQGPKIAGSSFKVDKPAQPRDYGKGGGTSDPQINVSFGDTLRTPELPETPPKSGVKDTLVKAKKLK